MAFAKQPKLWQTTPASRYSIIAITADNEDLRTFAYYSERMGDFREYDDDVFDLMGKVAGEWIVTADKLESFNQALRNGNIKYSYWNL